MILLGKLKPVALFCIISLFWGVLVGSIDLLVPFIKHAFELDFRQAMQLQTYFFAAFLFFTLPMGVLVKYASFVFTIRFALVLTTIGSFLIALSGGFAQWILTCFAVLIVATGVVLMQLSFPSYLSVNYPKQLVASRITLVQGFLALGTVIAPIFSSTFLRHVDSTYGVSADAIFLPYICLSLIFILLFSLSRYVEFNRQAKVTDTFQLSIYFDVLHRSRAIRLGMIGLFFYVGAEIAIGSMLFDYLLSHSESMFDAAMASKLVSCYWGGIMLGRFVGFWALPKINICKALMVSALFAILLTLYVSFGSGWTSAMAIIAVGLCNSIMGPTIYTSAIHDLGENIAIGSSLLIMSVFGGGIIGFVQAVIADLVTIPISFLVPCLSYFVILLVGYKFYKYS